MEVNDKVKDENIGIEQIGNQVIHVRGNSDSELEALFDCVLKPSSQMPLQKPFKMRNLPASFFTPPAHRQSPAPTVSHSREGSADSTYRNTGPAPGGGALRVGGTISPTPSQPQHFRHHSSPASLQQSLSIAQPPPNVHSKQHSFDALSDEQTALPPGWEQARTPQGQIYYLNHITQSTTWEDPRKKLQPLNTGAPQPSPVSSAQQAPTPSPSVVQQSHPPQSQPQQQLLMTATSSNTAPTTSSTITSATTGGITSASSQIPLVNPNLGPLPDGWEQGMSPDGEIYFINHSTKSTSWFDPRIPRHLQTISAQKVSSMLPQIGRTNLNSPVSLQRQNLELQRLQQEKEKRRQLVSLSRIQGVGFTQRRNGREDSSPLQSQVLSEGHQTTSLLQQRQPQLQISSISQVPSSTLSSLVSSVNSATSNQASSGELSFTSADPFMATSDFHSRQESADSGLGLGSNYTHPHTPEDFLAAMEDVEITPSGELKHHSANSMIVGSELESMDSEDLVPSITINDDISAEFLHDMLEPSKLENLQTWL